MIHIELGCKCCNLWVVPGRRGKKCLYQYNGQDFLGRSALGQSVGMSESQIDRRIATKTCLKMSTEDMKALHEGRTPGEPGEKADKTPRSDLVYAFCRNMAASFGRL